MDLVEGAACKETGEGECQVGGGVRCSPRKAEAEMVGWHHRLNEHESQQTLGDREGQGSLACCSPQGCKDLDVTEQVNNNNEEGRAAWRCPRRALVSQRGWGLHQSPCCSQPPGYAVDSQLEHESLKHWFGWVGRLFLMVRFSRNSPWAMV